MQKPAHVDFGFWISDLGFAFCGSPHGVRAKSSTRSWISFRIISCIFVVTGKKVGATKNMRAFARKMFALSRSLQAGSLRSGGGQRSDGSLRSGDLIFEKSFL
jgi:hypothetical protein